MKPRLLLLAAVLGVSACSVAPDEYTIVSTPHAVASTPLLAVPIPDPPAVTGTYPTTCHAVTEGGKTLPDPTCTPGSINPAVTQANIGSTICVKGWTATVRPPATNTGKVKNTAMRAYGEDPATRSTTELDHLVPLELGASDDVTNLWPEPSDLPGQGFRNTKDNVEWALNRAVCSGRVTLSAAQVAIATDWTTAESVLGLAR